MAEDNKGGTAEQGTSDAASGGQPDPAAQGGDNVEGLVAKNKELLGEVKKLKNKLSTFESQASKEQEAKLKEEGKLKELLDKKEGEVQAKTDRIRRAKLEAVAVRNGLVDEEYLEVLIKKIEFDENDQPVNAVEVFKELKEAKPYLFGQQAANPPAPGTANKSAASWKPGGKNMTLGEIANMSPEEIRKNQSEILRQGLQGLIKR